MYTDKKNNQVSIPKVNLSLTLENINKILIALGEMPYKQVFDLVQDIRVQTELDLATKGITKEDEHYKYEQSAANS